MIKYGRSPLRVKLSNQRHRPSLSRESFKRMGNGSSLELRTKASGLQAPPEVSQGLSVAYQGRKNVRSIIDNSLNHLRPETVIIVPAYREPQGIRLTLGEINGNL